MLPGQIRAAAGSPQQEEAGDDRQPTPAPTVITHFAPEKLRPQLEHATKIFPLAFNLFEDFLGAQFPLRSCHQVGGTGEYDCSCKVGIGGIRPERAHS